MCDMCATLYRTSGLSVVFQYFLFQAELNRHVSHPFKSLLKRSERIEIFKHPPCGKALFLAWFSVALEGMSFIWDALLSSWLKDELMPPISAPVFPSPGP